MRGEEDKGAAADFARQRGDDLLYADVEVLAVRRGQVGGQADKRLVEEVERRGEDELFGGSEADPRPEEVERPAHRQCRGREDCAAALGVDTLAQQGADVDRRCPEDQVFAARGEVESCRCVEARVARVNG